MCVIYVFVCSPTYACVEKPVVASFKPVSNQRVCLAAVSLLEGVEDDGGSRTAEELVQDCVCSPRRSAGAADEAGDGGGRKKGRSVRGGKVEETLTRRPAGTGRNGNARVGYFEIPWAGCRDRRRRLLDAEEEACEENGNGGDDE